jgi:hypothetical protein
MHRYGRIAFQHQPGCCRARRMRPASAGFLRGPPARGAPHTLTGRAHGDPFPLPCVGSGATSGKRRRGRSCSLLRRTNEALRALNSLDAPSHALRTFQPPLSRNAAQVSVLARVHRRVEAYGPRPFDMTGGAALESILKSKDFYSAAPTPVVVYDEAKFALLQSGIVFQAFVRPPTPFRPPHYGQSLHSDSHAS